MTLDLLVDGGASMRHDPSAYVERRYDRPYDDQSPSHIIHTNGTLVACGYRPMVASLLRDTWTCYQADIEAQRACPTCGRPLNPSDITVGICSRCGELLDQRRTA